MTLMAVPIVASCSMHIGSAVMISLIFTLLPPYAIRADEARSERQAHCLIIGLQTLINRAGASP